MNRSCILTMLKISKLDDLRWTAKYINSSKKDDSKC